MMSPVVAASKSSARALTPTSDPCSPWPTDRIATAARRTPTDLIPDAIHPSGSRHMTARCVEIVKGLVGARGISPLRCKCSRDAPGALPQEFSQSEKADLLQLEFEDFAVEGLEKVFRSTFD